MPTLLRPTLLLSLGIYHFFATVFEVVFIDRTPSKLFNLSALRFRGFARLWIHHGEEMSEKLPGPVNQLLQQSKGVVLDIGPGSGEILDRFDASKIIAMYGAEPAPELHPGLLRKAKKAGFGDKYHALLCGGEPESLIPALSKSGVLTSSGTGGTAENGVFDEICCVRVLCGVPHLDETTKGLYHLLKPGGRMVICEHVAVPWRTEGSLAARFVQIVTTLLGWPFFVGCELQRHTLDHLREAAGSEGWEKFDLQYVEPKTMVPFIVGELRKKL
ncbi:hypothetical protein EJ04DRAFT_444990 [Polyplosphaeria fusca]|uniref:S-adenosyl-L-methionine-dependent methyltransferase n=1 Tax=Polyplosphaeria fusca TaxID=682080 RepID=A0A9P4QQ87_9PLEO|nr:hypothetical protein EJ04DRAFT_444990 [Polyplosphaeria fusca]